MKFIRTVPGYRTLPRIDCFHCVACGLDETIVESNVASRAASPDRRAGEPREAAADGLEFLNLTRALGIPQQARVDPRTAHLFAVGRRACARCTDGKARCGELATTGRVAFSDVSSICPGVNTVMALLHHWPRAPDNLSDRRSRTD